MAEINDDHVTESTVRLTMVRDGHGWCVAGLISAFCQLARESTGNDAKLMIDALEEEIDLIKRHFGRGLFDESAVN